MSRSRRFRDRRGATSQRATRATLRLEEDQAGGHDDALATGKRCIFHSNQGRKRKEKKVRNSNEKVSREKVNSEWKSFSTLKTKKLFIRVAGEEKTEFMQRLRQRVCP